MKSLRRHDTQCDEHSEHQKLCDDKWRLGSCWRERMQERQFLESLHHAEEDIQIESQHYACNVDPAPQPGKTVDIERKDRDREYRQRDEPDEVSRSEACRVKQKSGHARGYCRGEKEHSRAIRPRRAP